MILAKIADLNEIPKDCTSCPFECEEVKNVSYNCMLMTCDENLREIKIRRVPRDERCPLIEVRKAGYEK